MDKLQTSLRNFRGASGVWSHEICLCCAPACLPARCRCVSSPPEMCQSADQRKGGGGWHMSACLSCVFHSPLSAVQTTERENRRSQCALTSLRLITICCPAPSPGGYHASIKPAVEENLHQATGAAPRDVLQAEYGERLIYFCVFFFPTSPSVQSAAHATCSVAVCRGVR